MRIVKGKAVEEELREIVARRIRVSSEAERVAARVIRDIRRRGDAALRDFATQWDQLAPKQSLRVTDKECQGALTQVAPEFLRALKAAAINIRRFARMQMPKPFLKQLHPGVRAGQAIRPLESVGCYVPGGRYPLPSSLLMTVIPAQVAGVRDIAVCSPNPAPETLAAAALLGVKRVYRIGGAQAIAALAYGTSSVAPVQKIVGPGNRYVTAAKKRVAFDCGIDFLAGPTEAVLVADRGDPRFIAADLLAQSEHDPDACAIFVTSSRALAEAVASTVRAASRNNRIAAEALRRNGCILLTRSMEDSMRIANTIASEHTTIPARQLTALQNSGSIFLGEYSAQALGDYVSGPNHVLPTSGAARFRGGLSVLDFLKVITVQEVSRTGIRKLASTAATLATAEGLHAHAESIRVRCSGA